MEQYEAGIESGHKLSPQGAQAIVEEVGAVVGQNINMMDCRGYVIASTDETRIGSLHEGARRVIEEHLTELYIKEQHATLTSRPGLNLPVTYCGEIVGVIGITGRYEEVAGYGRVVKKMVEILMRENAVQDERRMGRRVLNRFLKDWVIGDGLKQPKLLEERGAALGIDIRQPRRVMVAGAREPEEYSSTAAGQKLLEQMEREAAALSGSGGLVLRSAGRQIILVKKCTDRQMEQAAGRIRAAVLEKFGIPLVIGIDGRAEDAHGAYGQAVRAWRCACLSKKDILPYENVTLELFTGDLGEGVKKEYIRKVFGRCGYEELGRWMGLLEAYFEAEGSLRAASESLHIHKNTLTYKLKRLKEMTGYDVRLVSQSAVFYMALLFFRDVRHGMEDEDSVR